MKSCGYFAFRSSKPIVLVCERTVSLTIFFSSNNVCFDQEIRKISFCLRICNWRSDSFTFYTRLIFHPQGPVVQSVTCLATDACLTADPGVASLIPARSQSFLEIDHEIISTVFFFRCIIQEELLSVTSENMCMKYWLIACSSLPRKE